MKTMKNRLLFAHLSPPKTIAVRMVILREKRWVGGGKNVNDKFSRGVQIWVRKWKHLRLKKARIIEDRGKWCENCIRIAEVEKVCNEGMHDDEDMDPENTVEKRTEKVGTVVAERVAVPRRRTNFRGVIKGVGWGCFRKTCATYPHVWGCICAAYLIVCWISSQPPLPSLLQPILSPLLVVWDELAVKRYAKKSLFRFFSTPASSYSFDGDDFFSTSQVIEGKGGFQKV